jgi:hypothetical protein
MNNSNIVNKLQSVTVFLVFLMFPIISSADLHILYQNDKNNAQKIEIFFKIEQLKVINTDNNVKIVNLSTKTAYLYKSGDSRYLEIKIGKESNPAKDLFSPQVLIIVEKDKKPKTDFVQGEYKSSIDDKVLLKLKTEISRGMVDSYREALKYLYWNGNEILKEPFYYYSLKDGYVPIGIKSKEYSWKAVLFEDKPLDDTVFSPPKEMTAVKSKAYLKELVDKISEDLESEIIP